MPRNAEPSPATQFALLFVGGQGCYEVLRREPMLHSRLYAIVRFQELSDPECCEVLPAFHSLYADVAPELIISARCPPGLDGGLPVPVGARCQFHFMPDYECHFDADSQSAPTGYR